MSDARQLFAAGVAVVAACAMPKHADGQTRPISIFIVRHAETDQKPPTFRLTEAGRQRAGSLMHTFRDVKFTQIFASHTSWARETVEPLATAHGLKVVQLPRPGSTVDGDVITDETSRRAAIEPVAAALKELPAGSIVLAVLNGENIFAILNRLGVPVATVGQTCSAGDMCVPCTDNSCFPQKEFDHLWHLMLEPGRAEPLSFVHLRYGPGSRTK